MPMSYDPNDPARQAYSGSPTGAQPSPPGGVSRWLRGALGALGGGALWLMMTWSPTPPPRPGVRVVPSREVASSSATDAGIAATWCTLEAVEQADVHHRGPFGDRMPAVMGFLNLAGGLRLNHRALGWHIMGARGDTCAVQFHYQNEEETKIALFGLFRRSVPHLVPIDRNASDVTDLFDLWVSATARDGGPTTTDPALQAAREMRDTREQSPGLEDVYIDHPDGHRMVLEMLSCSESGTPGEASPLTRRLQRAGITHLVCRDAAGREVVRELPRSRRHHR